MTDREAFEAWWATMEEAPNYEGVQRAVAWNAWQAARAQPAQAGLHQALTDPENQPNQYGIEFLMHGPKFAFKVGTQQFTLDYEPTEPGEFEFMQAALIYAFSVFTPDVKPAQAVPVLSDEEIRQTAQSPFTWDNYRAIEQAVRAKMGVSVPMTEKAIHRLWKKLGNGEGIEEFARAIEKHHGIVGKEGA